MGWTYRLHEEQTGSIYDTIAAATLKTENAKGG